MTPERSAERRHMALMESLAEETSAQDEVALALEVEAEGESPAAAAEAVRIHLRAAGKRYRQRLLRAAAAEYRRATERLSTRWVDLPDDPGARRDLLAGIFAQVPQMEDAFLTVQHREFRELTDCDVESCLAQLAELGLLDGDADDDGPQGDGGPEGGAP